MSEKPEQIRYHFDSTEVSVVLIDIDEKSRLLASKTWATVFIDPDTRIILDDKISSKPLGPNHARILMAIFNRSARQYFNNLKKRTRR
jgi:hypothetical protein